MTSPFENGNWNFIQGKDLNEFLEKVSPIDGQYATNPSTTKVAWQPQPFYKKVALIKVEEPSWGPNADPLFFLGYGGNFYRLNGMSTPIHEVNHTAKIYITEENVLEYLRFFCFFVHGDKGPFLIAEDPSALKLPESIRPEVKELINDSVTEATFNGMTADGKFDCSGMVYYGTSLFSAQFHVYPNGLIEMVDDEPIVQDTAG